MDEELVDKLEGGLEVGRRGVAMEGALEEAFVDGEFDAAPREVVGEEVRLDAKDAELRGERRRERSAAEARRRHLGQAAGRKTLQHDLRTHHDDSEALWPGAETWERS